MRQMSRIIETMKTLTIQSKSKPDITQIFQDQVIYMGDITVITNEENEETREIMQEFKQIISIPSEESHT